MASYQDIDIRLKVVEDKIDFILNTIPVAKKVPSFDPADPGYKLLQYRLLDLYRELKAVGGTLVQELTQTPAPTTEAEVSNG